MSMAFRVFARQAMSTGLRSAAGRCEQEARERKPSLRLLAPASALFIASLLYGCASFVPTTPPPPSLTCRSALQCVVRIEVDCTSTPCTPSVNHPNVDANNHDIVWEIVPKAGQSYVFENPGGIFFKTASGRRAFRCHAEVKNTRYKCHGDRDGGTYEYGIELIGSPPASKLDPWVVNR